VQEGKGVLLCSWSRWLERVASQSG